MDKIKDLIKKYREDFEKEGAEPLVFEGVCTDDDQAFDHCFAVLNQIEELLESGNIAKANRWLGFVQCILFSNGIYSFEEINKHHWDLNELE